LVGAHGGGLTVSGPGMGQGVTLRFILAGR